MKNTIALALIIVLVIAAMAGCGKKEKVQESSSETSTITGGWTLNEAITDSALTDEQKTVFEKAQEGFTGQSFVPIACLGTQVVAGRNYRFLCLGTLVAAEPVNALKVVTVYRDLNDNATIQNVSDFEIADLADSEGTAAGLAGGWTVNEELGTACISDEASSALNEAAAGLTGAGYEPAAELATQVVAGINYALLCKQTAVTVEPAVNYAVVIVYKPVTGTAQIRDVYTLDLASFGQ